MKINKVKIIKTSILIIIPVLLFSSSKVSGSSGKTPSGSCLDKFNSCVIKCELSQLDKLQLDNCISDCNKIECVN